MGNQMSDCCNQLNGDISDLRTQTSASLMLLEKAKQEGYIETLLSTKSKLSKTRYSFGLFTSSSTLKLQSIDSTKATNHGLTISPSVSNDMIYSMESSDSENDPILSNDVIRKKLLSKHNKKKDSIKIPESSTTSAEHKLEEAVITDTNDKNKKPKNKYKQIMRAKNKNTTYSLGALKQELSECEIKLKQEQHEKDILKLENEALREKISQFHAKYGVIDSGFDFNELYIKKTTSTSTEKGYQPQQSQELSQLLSPSQSIISNNDLTPTSSPKMPKAINWSNSSNVDITSPSNKLLSPSADKYNLNISPSNVLSPSNKSSLNISPSSYITSNTNISPSNGTNLNQYPSITPSSYTTNNNKDEILTLTQLPTLTIPDATESILSINGISQTNSNSVPDFSKNTLSLDLFCIDNHEEHSLEIDSCSPCISIESCSAIKRIINALKWYSISGDDHESVYKKMKGNNYGKRIVDDYNHIMEYHLDDNNNTLSVDNKSIDVRREYDLIVNEVTKYVEPCTFIQCAGYRRYLRSRNENVHKAQTIHQHEVQMYVNTMDGIHCCFMHLAKSFQLR